MIIHGGMESDRYRQNQRGTKKESQKVTEIDRHIGKEAERDRDRVRERNTYREREWKKLKPLLLWSQ